MVKKIIISLLILHGIYVAISNSIIEPDMIRTIEKADPLNAIVATKNLLQEGDMVFRLNMDGYSQYIKKFNRQDKQYSHAGIVVMENGTPIIYHMVSEDENTDNKMSKYSYEEFINPKKNYSFGIYRNNLSDAEKMALIKQIKQWYNEEVEFDYNFNLQTNDKMYCSEMIAKAIAKATNNRIDINSTQLTSKEAIAFAAYLKKPVEYTKDLKIVAIDNLYKHKWCRVVKEYEFKR
jgi:hypothetical protein